MKKRWLPWSAGIVVCIAILVLMWNAGFLSAGIQENNFQYENGRAAYIMMRLPGKAQVNKKTTAKARKAPSKRAVAG